MNLSQNNFCKGACMFKQRGITIEGKVYSYASGKDLFDVLILNGLKYYQKNMRGYSIGANMIEPIHREVERHFNI